MVFITIKGVASVQITLGTAHLWREMPSEASGSVLGRSLDSSTEAKITFENASNSSVAVLWLNFDGDPVWYRQLPPGCSYDQSTYVNHSWVCVECDTGLFSLMKINKQDELCLVQRNTVHAVITAPEVSLFQTCLAALRRYLHEVKNVSLVEQLQAEDFPRLHLPSRCVEQLSKLDSSPPPQIAEKYVKNLKQQLSGVPKEQWNQVLMGQGRTDFVEI